MDARITPPIAGPRYQQSSPRAWDIKPDRLVTFIGDGTARWRDTGAPITKQISLQVIEASHLKGARAALVKGLPVNSNGQPRRGAVEREAVAPEGSFIVWWNE